MCVIVGPLKTLLILKHASSIDRFFLNWWIFNEALKNYWFKDGILNFFCFVKYFFGEFSSFVKFRPDEFYRNLNRIRGLWRFFYFFIKEYSLI
jgi:hypothetical protein